MRMARISGFLARTSGFGTRDAGGIGMVQIYHAVIWCSMLSAKAAKADQGPSERTKYILSLIVSIARNRFFLSRRHLP